MVVPSLQALADTPGPFAVGDLVQAQDDGHGGVQFVGASVDLSGLMLKAGGTFTGAITLDLGAAGAAGGAAELIFNDTPASSATVSLVQFGSALVAGNAAGTYIGGNAPNGFVGDFARWQVNNVDKLQIGATQIQTWVPIIGSGSPALGNATTGRFGGLFAGSGDFSGGVTISGNLQVTGKANLDASGTLASGFYDYLTCGTLSAIGTNTAANILALGGYRAGSWAAVTMNAGGSEVGRWTTTGLGIGGTPSNLLHIIGPQSSAANNTTTGSLFRVNNSLYVRVHDGTTGISGSGFATQLISGAGAGPFEIYTLDTAPLVLGVNSAEVARLTSTGLGIGASPLYALHVNANVANYAAAVLQQHTLGYGLLLIPGSDSREALQVNNAANSLIRHGLLGSGSAYFANGAGSVGIGTSSPGTKLDVVGPGSSLSGTANFTARFRDSTSPARGVGLGYDTSGQIGVIYPETSSAASSLAFWTYSGSAWGEGMRLTSTGLGIGITPSYALHVEKAAALGNTLAFLRNTVTTAGQSYGVAIQAGTNSTDSSLSILNATGTARFKIEGSGNLRVYNPAGDNYAAIYGSSVGGAGTAELNLVGGSGSGILVNNAGNVGVGGTPTQKFSVLGSSNGFLGQSITNSNTGSGSLAGLLVFNDAGTQLSIFLNGANKTSDGGVNTAVIRTESGGGDLHLGAGGARNITVAAAGLLPVITANYNLGSSSLTWKNFYTGAANIGTTQTGVLNPDVTDGASAIAYLFDTKNALPTAGARALSVRVNAVEQMHVSPTVGMITRLGMGMFATVPPTVQPVGGALTAGAAYGANEQTMLNALWSMARGYGMLS